MDHSWLKRAIALLAVIVFVLVVFKFRLDEEAQRDRRMCEAQVWDNSTMCHRPD